MANQHEAYTPTVPVQVRTVTYFVTVGVSALTIAIVGLSPIWFETSLSAQITASASVIGASVAFIAGALGVAYRPTK